MNITSAALFALDAYNRANPPDGLEVPFGATVILDREDGEFAAVAYHLPDTNEIVVAYRGTTDLLWDGVTSYPIAVGQYDWVQSQVDLAFAFLNDVTAAMSGQSGLTWCFTGHSLGGALAGLVASVSGESAYVFDAMPFVQASLKLYLDVTGDDAAQYEYWQQLAYPNGIAAPSFSSIVSASMENEALEPLREGTSFSYAGGLTVTSGLDAQTIVQNEIRGGTVSDVEDLHSQALMAIALHGGLQHSAEREVGGDAVYHHLFDGALAVRLGFVDSEALRQNLAYTLDDSGTAALDGLFADMDQLGAMRLAEINQSIPASRYFGALGKLSVVHAVHVAGDGDAGMSVGLIKHVNGAANIDLSGTLDAIGTINDFIEFAAVVPAGVFFDLSQIPVANLAVAWSGYGGTAYLQPGGTIFLGSEYVDDVYGSDENDIILSMGSDGTFFDNIWGGAGNDVIYASAGADKIHDGSGNDRAHGGIGNDTFHSGTGSDAMFGEADNDTFHLGDAEEGDVDYVNGGAHTGTGDVVEPTVSTPKELLRSGTRSSPTGSPRLPVTGSASKWPPATHSSRGSRSSGPAANPMRSGLGLRPISRWQVPPHLISPPARPTS
ncbi:DUF2974 domain-containing protein [Devosia sp. ZB163]|uniref:Mbeg1-like protein n=1 Tax=Devosia sp. ZB163 TaxID=3025938 RepID=UPI002360CF97|nr:Mbeg1-like protein [Devosia sp. ZB163]MDC9824833.1 DUF2974 domain-containing protein [Devosia sp. ZB163]